ncbi:MAG: hydrogenase [Candidatus Melainabacteria bacterium]|nr:MAG: hydrogenase [Candidatus Melainabacteria bacterium]
MKLNLKQLSSEERTARLKAALDAGDRLGLITSIDGDQLIMLLLSPGKRSIDCYETPVAGGTYKSATAMVPQAHWFERTTWDMFGLVPEGHPRLKRTHLHEPYTLTSPPLSHERRKAIEKTIQPESGDRRHAGDRSYHFLGVEGQGVYEIPVGPIHAGIIEPGHFRFSCYGEIILNLEIRLGYVHRGIEKRLSEVPWQRGRFVAEAAASDMPVANSLAHATAVEYLLQIEVPRLALYLRSIALEIERIAMHLSDLGGLAGDIGFLAIASSMGRLRGVALRMGELLSGNRLMRGFICPGGVVSASMRVAEEIAQLARQLKQELKPVVAFYMDNQVAVDRMEGVGVVRSSLAREFGLVGVAARASGDRYDCRNYWNHGAYPNVDLEPANETSGDVFARAKVRISEIETSLKLLINFLDDLKEGSFLVSLPDRLEANSSSVAIVESHRGELIHFIHTDARGEIQRYCIKDASVNNWTALAIAVRNNVVADFPLCNKSFSLSYSGHDL